MASQLSSDPWGPLVSNFGFYTQSTFSVIVELQTRHRLFRCRVTGGVSGYFGCLSQFRQGLYAEFSYSPFSSSLSKITCSDIVTVFITYSQRKLNSRSDYILFPKRFPNLYNILTIFTLYFFGDVAQLSEQSINQWYVLIKVVLLFKNLKLL